MIDLTTFSSPIGEVAIAVRDGSVVACMLDEGCEDRLRARFPGEEIRVAGESWVTDRARAYLEGDLAALDDVPVDLGGTAFQESVWSALRRVPAGRTVSYGELARAIGKPEAVRAVGGACGANPAWLIVPCHRAVRSDGGLGGYAGGLEVKRWLLAHERAQTSIPV